MLSADQYRVLEMLIDDSMTQKDIAKEIGIAPETISRWKKDKEFEEEYIKLLRQTFAQVAPKAKRKMIGLMSCGLPNVEYSAAKDILDRAGLKAVDKSENVNVNLNTEMTDEEAEAIITEYESKK